MDMDKVLYKSRRTLCPLRQRLYQSSCDIRPYLDLFPREPADMRGEVTLIIKTVTKFTCKIEIVSGTNRLRLNLQTKYTRDRSAQVIQTHFRMESVLVFE